MSPVASIAKPSSQIIVCGQTVPVDWDRVYNFRDHPSFDATQLHCYFDAQMQPTTRLLPFRPAEGIGASARRFSARSLMHGGTELGRLQQIIRQFVLHHDGLFSSEQCFHVLHDERGLSVHFLIDNDGTIYQTLDLVHCAYHATGVNTSSIGVELCNRGKFLSTETRYYRGTPERGQQTVRIHGSEYLMWQFTEQQYQAMIALGQTLLRLFPNLPQTFPEDSRGELIPTTISDPRGFSGYLGHYHVTPSKWDPGCFDFARVLNAIRGKPTWFVMPGAEATLISSDPSEAQAQAHALLENNQKDAMGGYFPVGPCGNAHVWHGGIHLSQPEGTPIFCPFAGRIVAARWGLSSATGSCDFVLVEHRLTVAGKSVQFFLLLFHVDLSVAPPWLTRARRRHSEPLRAEEVGFPGVAVGGGDLLGRIGLAGPPGSLEGQIHIEILSTAEIGAELQPGTFRALSPSSPGPFCGEPEILGLLERSRARPGPPSRSLLRDFFQREPESHMLLNLAARFQSEWVQDAARDAALLRSPEFMALRAPRSVFRDQIQPAQWWTPEVARRTGLPVNGVVWHYHPVTFIAWMSGLIQKDLRARPAATAADAPKAQVRPATDGYSGEEGYLDDEDRMSQESNNLTLEQIIEGWPEQSAPPTGR